MDSEKEYYAAIETVISNLGSNYSSLNNIKYLKAILLLNKRYESKWGRRDGKISECISILEQYVCEHKD